MTPVSTPSRTARAVVALALFAPLGTAGCGGADDKVDYILSREALDFGTVAWSDPVTPSATLSVLNPNNDELRVSVLEVRGDGADAVEIGDVEDFTLVSSEGSLSFEVSLAADRTLWDDGEFKVELVLQIGKLVDVSSDWNDPADWRATEATVPVYFTIGCDLDGDLAEDATCGGDDCDDENPSAVLGGNEVCDDADNDCDGYTDEEAADAATWYGDGDGDGYGVDGVVTAACDAPPGFVADGGDCDDFTTTRSPVAEETCNDLDDDCDGETDEDATDAPLWHADLDGDGFGDPASATAACEAPAGWVADGTDCDDLDGLVSPGAAETCNAADDDCDGETDEDAVDVPTWYADADADGFGDAVTSTLACEQPPGWVADPTDCDDTDASVGSGTVYYADGDGDGFGDPAIPAANCAQPDGYVADARDCDDTTGSISPDDAEICDGLDNDCDGSTDTGAGDATAWFADADLDGFGDAATSTDACDAPAGFVADDTDCDDADALAYPSAPELCDGLDNDCDAAIDDDTVTVTWYADADGDTYGDPATTTDSCAVVSGYVLDAADCDDADAAVSPAGTETCNGLDDDCDGVADDDAADALAWYADADGDGFGDAATTALGCDAPSGHVADATDCDDADASVGGLATWFADADGDTFGDAATTAEACAAPGGYVADDTDCDDADALAYPAAPELCDGLDNDCDAAIDDDTVSVTWYADADGDGLGDAASTTDACSQPSGHVADDTDCDDADAGVGGPSTWYADADGDGFGDAANTTDACAQPSGYVGDATDCDDADGSVTTGATWYADGDGDGFGDAATPTDACSAPGGHVADDTDCDDADLLSYPGATEVCDGLDNDCDAAIDDGAVDLVTWHADGDGDGYGDAAVTTDACSQPSGFVADDTDCDDADGGVGGPSTWYADADTDGFGDAASPTDACTQPGGYVADATDCDDADGSVTTGATWYADADADGLGDAASTTTACAAPGGYVADATDCDDADGAVGGPAAWYADADGDGFGDAAVTTDACSQPSGQVADDTDCDDADGATFPGAAEAADAGDDDCDEWIDEDFVVAGDVVVTELFLDATAGAGGLQWLEVVNVTADTLYLDGWEVYATDGATTSTFWLSPGAAVAIPAGAAAVFCQDATAMAAAAPTVICDYEYGVADNGWADSLYGADQDAALRLSDTAGTVRLSLAGVEVDAVSWDPTWTVTAGASLALDPTLTDDVGNDSAAAWCAGATAYSTDGLSLGTPGSANESCGG